MKRFAWTTAVVLALAAAIGGGYWLGSRGTTVSDAGTQAAAHERQV